MLDATLQLRHASIHAPRVSYVDHPRQLGDYRLLREIGRGGMGIVYEAEQESLHRRVALKIMAGPSRWDSQARERFEREARSAAKLHHTNIVPIFEVGTASDECFYAMQYIDGIGLDALIARLAGKSGSLESIPVASPLVSATHPKHYHALAQLALQVASGLAHAHVRGVIHRDIKPANLLLDTAGVVWITDFGLAKHADDNLTRTGDLFGTIRYMAPERFRGMDDPRCDIYALGATLYELVTRQAAYPDMTEPSHFARLDVEPPAPSTIAPNVPRDLETIILKAMDRDPERRYQTAQELTDDLRRFLDDEPIRARPIGMLGRATRWARRRPVLASLIGAVVALTATVIVGAITAAMAFRDLAENEAHLRRKADAASELASKQAKAAVDAHKASQEISDLMLGVLDETDPLAFSGRVFSGNGRSEELKPAIVLQRTLDKLKTAAEIQPKERAKLLCKIGAIYVSIGEVDKGRPLLEESLSLRRAEHGPESLEVAETLHQIGLAHLTRKSYDEAEEAYRKALAIRERYLHPDDRLITLTLTQLGVVKAFDHDSVAAAELLQRAQASLRKHPGPESREYAITIIVLAMVHLGDGKVNEAAQLLPEALRLIEKHEGDTPLARAVRLYLQAHFASRIGVRELATEPFVESIQLVTKSLGEDHFLVLLVRTELASHYHEIGKLKEADAEYKIVQDLCIKNFSAQSGSAAGVKMLRARVLRDQRRYAEAEPMLAEACVAMRKVKHTSLARCLHIYAEILQKQGRIDEALPPLVESVKERKKTTNFLWYSNAASDLAYLFLRQGQPEKAVHALDEANRHLANQPTLPARVYWLLGCRSARQCQLHTDLCQEQQADEAANRAIDALRAALATRGATAKELAKETALSPLRDRPAFKKLLAETIP